MTKTEEIEIPLSKSKLSLMLTGSLAFVAAGIWFVTMPKEISMQSICKSPMLIFSAGLASILFFWTMCNVYCEENNGQPSWACN